MIKETMCFKPKEIEKEERKSAFKNDKVKEHEMKPLSLISDIDNKMQVTAAKSKAMESITGGNAEEKALMRTETFSGSNSDGGKRTGLIERMIQSIFSVICSLDDELSSKSTALHLCVWCFILMICSPIAGVALFAYTILRSVQFFIGLFIPQKIDGENNDGYHYERCVFITGCDTGFGQTVAHELSNSEKYDFVVFACCYSDRGMEQYQDKANVITVKLDVTKDVDVDNAANAVKEWLNEPLLSNGNTHGKQKKNIKRVLHAVVNNAGIGSCGPIDWTVTEDFERVMEVNLYGQVRCFKAFLSILKEQCRSEVAYEESRFVTMCSFVGKISLPGSPAYVCSKQAVEALNNSFRLELGQSFPIKVCTVNPSVTGTTMLDVGRVNVESKWRELSDEMKEEYGQG